MPEFFEELGCGAGAPEEFRRDERRKLVFHSREQRPSIQELYEGV
jgi:hypothetical protein